LTGDALYFFSFRISSMNEMTSNTACASRPHADQHQQQVEEDAEGGRDTGSLVSRIAQELRHEREEAGHAGVGGVDDDDMLEVVEKLEAGRKIGRKIALDQAKASGL
jgi:hypothetical protein